MKRLITLFMLSGLICGAEEVTITKSTVLRADRSIVAVKAGAVVEVLGRDEKTLTVRYNKLTGTIPLSAVAAVAAPESTAKKQEEPAPTPPPERKAQTNYGKAVEKAKENASKHEKNLVKPTDEVLAQ